MWVGFLGGGAGGAYMWRLSSRNFPMETNDHAEITASGYKSVSCTQALDSVMNDTLVCQAASDVLTFSS